MSRSGEYMAPWADGDYTFRLPWGQLVELQEKCDAGPYVILRRIAAGEWRVQDLSNIVRLGLIGGGVEPKAALQLTRDYVEARPLAESVLIAHEILSAAILGTGEEQPGGARGGKSSGDVIDDLPNGKLRFAAIYGNGAAMGFSPREVKAMSVFEFFSALDGWIAANVPDDEKVLSSKEKDELADWLGI